jgi:hypothetical protein
VIDDGDGATGHASPIYFFILKINK